MVQTSAKGIQDNAWLGSKDYLCKRLIFDDTNIWCRYKP